MVMEIQGKNAEAEVLYKEALEEKRRVFGNDHLATLGEVSNLSTICFAQGKYEEAELMIQALISDYPNHNE